MKPVAFGALMQRCTRSFKPDFATKHARFRLAVTSGFLVGAVVSLTLGVRVHSGAADSLWGAMNLFGLGAAPEMQAPSAVSADYRDPDPARASRRHARKRVGEKTYLANLQTGGMPTAFGGKSMCVRLCDGYAFPVGDYHGDGDRAAHEATCRSECPGAQTSLYVLPAGVDTMDKAVQASTGKNYSELPDAFHYASVLSDACSCHPPEGARINSVLRDFTLRRGDAVMTAQGIKVFHGAQRFPYRRTDFVALSRSRDIQKANRTVFRAIEQAHLKAPKETVIADVAPTRQQTTASTNGLRHEASR